MKKSKIISIITCFLLLLSTIVLATEPQVSIVGESTAKPSETKTAVVSISNEDIALGVVSGKVEKGANITNISVSGKNSWNLTYNEETGAFNIYKASGAKSEEIMNIEYTVSSEEGTAQIALRDVKITTIDYETKNIGDITKIITIKNEVVEPDDEGNAGDSKDEENAGDSDDKKNTVNPDNKVTNSGNTNNKKDNTASKDKEIPQTGEEVITIVMISSLMLLSIVSYIGYKKYKIV